MDNPTSMPVVTSPAQRLCVRCGLCCDGTIFPRARLVAEDAPERLAAAGFIPVTGTTGKGFALPCHHHQQRICTIYGAWRPHICQTFRCALLRRFEAGTLTLTEAQALIARTVEQAGRVWAGVLAGRGARQVSLKGHFLAWQQAQQEAGVDVKRAQAPFMLDYVSLQYRLDREFRVKKDVPATLC